MGHVDAKGTITTKQILLYGLPAGAMAVLFGGPLFVLQGVYAKYYGISLTTIATILLIANLFDAITDPIIGYLSDRYYSKKGNRKPFILFGGLLFIIGAYYLFMPPNDIENVYFLSFFLVFYLGFTLFNIPHHAWGNDLSSDFQSSTRIFTYRTMIVTVGGLLFYSIPLLPVFETTEFTPQTLEFAVHFFGLLIIPVLFLCIYFVPDKQQSDFTSRHISKSLDSSSSSENIKNLWTGIIHNKPFLWFLGAYFFSGLGAGSWGALSFIFIDTYLNMGANFSFVAICGMGFGALGLPIWSRIAVGCGKITAWIVSIILTSLGIICMKLLVPETSDLFLLALVIAPIFVGFIAFAAFSTALLSDIVDYTKLKFNGSYAGCMFSIYFFITKTNVAIGSAIGMTISGLYGFEPSAVYHTPESVMGLTIASIYFPITLLLISLFFVARIPINKRRHSIVCKALARRDSRVERHKFVRCAKDTKFFDESDTGVRTFP